MPETIKVTWLELVDAPAGLERRQHDERVAVEKLTLQAYLDLYARVGEPLQWDQRLRMPREALARLLSSDRSVIHVMRSGTGAALGFCEFELSAADVELKNFGLLPAAQGRGLGPRLLLSALADLWERRPGRIWLHTDTHDHPAALPLYLRAGFRVYARTDEPPDGL